MMKTIRRRGFALLLCLVMCLSLLPASALAEGETAPEDAAEPVLLSAEEEAQATAEEAAAETPEGEEAAVESPAEEMSVELSPLADAALAPVIETPAALTEAVSVSDTGNAFASIHSFAELKAAVEAYDGSDTYIYYNDTEEFVFAESITLPEHLYFCADAEGSSVRVPAGVTLSVTASTQNAFYVQNLVVEGSMSARRSAVTYLTLSGEVSWLRVPVASGTCGAEGSNLSWILYDDGTLILSGAGAMADGECPWETFIEEIRSVTVESGVTAISEGAFAWAVNLSSVSLPSTLGSIGEYAFNNCGSLTAVTIPAGVTQIGQRAFYACYALARIDAAAENTAYASRDGILYNKAQTELICCPPGKAGSPSVPAGVTTIGPAAFEYCRISALVLPEGVVSIGESAFDCCFELAEVTLPESLQQIGAYAFNRCFKLTEIAIPASVTAIGASAFEDCRALLNFRVADGNSVYASVDGVLFNRQATRLISYPIGRSGAYTVPEGTLYIGEGAFYNCGTLTQIELPNGLLSLESSAFNSCIRLAELSLPSSLQELQGSAFQNCSSLTNVTLFPGLNRISEDAFYNCSALQNVYFYGTAAQRQQKDWAVRGNESFLNAEWHYLGTDRSIHSFAELKAAVESFDGNESYVYYNDSEPFVIEESITLPKNFYFCADAEGSVLRIPAGVTLTVESEVRNAFYTEQIVLDGTLVCSADSLVGTVSGSGLWKQSDTAFIFYSENALRELAAGSFSEAAAALYGGSDSFAFTRDLDTPAELRLSFPQAVQVAAGAQVSIRGSFDAKDLVIDGSLTLENSGSKNTPDSSITGLTVSGSFTVRGRIGLHGDLTGRDKLTLDGSAADFRWYVDADGLGETVDWLAVAQADSTPHFTYCISSTAGEADGFVLELFFDMEIPANTTLSVNSDFVLAAGAVLHNAGTLEILAPMTVNGSLVNDSSVLIVPYELGMSLEDGGSYSGEGEITVMADAPTREALSALLPGLDLNYFADVQSEESSSGTVWHLRRTAPVPMQVTAKAASLNLDGTIGLNFKVVFSDSVLESENAEAVFLYKEQETRKPIAGMSPDSNGYYVFTFRIPAPEFANTVQLKFMAGDTVIPFCNSAGRLENDTLSYSGQRYSEVLPAGNRARALIDALHSYCHYAYYGLEYSEPNVAPDPKATTPDISSVTAASVEPYKNVVTGSVTGLSANAISLMLESATEINIKFKLQSGHSISEYSFKLDGMTVTPVYKGGLYIVTVRDIAAKDLDTRHTLVVTAGEEQLTISTCALSYCYSVLANNLLTTEMQNTCKALYLYNQAANAYFGS